MTKSLLDLKDETIVAAFKTTRSAQYFRALVTRHEKRLRSTAFRILGSADEAEEIVQETFIRALQNIHKFKTSGSLSAWLYAITHNLCVDALRLKYKNGEFQSTSIDSLPTQQNHDQSRRNRYVFNQIVDRLPDPSEQAELKEQMKMIANSLSRISEKQRIVVVLHDVKGFSYEDIALLIGTSVGTVRSRLHYGRIKLRKILRPYLSSKK